MYLTLKEDQKKTTSSHSGNINRWAASDKSASNNASALDLK